MVLSSRKVVLIRILAIWRVVLLYYSIKIKILYLCTSRRILTRMYVEQSTVYDKIAYLMCRSPLRTSKKKKKKKSPSLIIYWKWEISKTKLWPIRVEAISRWTLSYRVPTKALWNRNRLIGDSICIIGPRITDSFSKQNKN